MSGRYEKAPLIYVTARLKTSTRPKLREDQWADFQQALIRKGLKNVKKSTSQDINVVINQDKAKIEPTVSENTRHGFFSSTDEECLILGLDHIEYRVSTYSKYNYFRDRFFELLQAIMASVEILGDLDVSEFLLTYCDVIVPAYGRPLKEYFSDSSILPLNYVEHYTDDKWQTGQMQATRIVTSKQKITLSLEQLPVEENKGITKWLPTNMIEPDNAFAMPLHIRSEWKGGLHERKFALLSTQATMLHRSTLKQFDAEETFDNLHELTKSTFNKIIDDKVCREDWNYQSQ